MNGPRVVCAVCGREVPPFKTVCDTCLIAAGETPIPFCALCEATLVTNSDVLRATNGIHNTKSGGYAGKCAAVFAPAESA